MEELSGTLPGRLAGPRDSGSASNDNELGLCVIETEYDQDPRLTIVHQLQLCFALVYGPITLQPPHRPPMGNHLLWMPLSMSE